MSCSIDEYYAQYDEDTKHAVEDIKCGACGETIRSGQKYVAVSIWRQEDATEEAPEDGENGDRIYDDGFYLSAEPSESLDRCARCQTIHLHLRGLGDRGDELWPDEQLDCGEEYADHWGKEPPEEIAALAFALPEEVQGTL